MRLELFAIFDCAANQAGPVFQAVNEQVAARNFRLTMKEVVEPESYKLYRIGSYDDSDMEIKPEVNPVEVFTGVKNA